MNLNFLAKNLTKKNLAFILDYIILFNHQQSDFNILRNQKATADKIHIMVLIVDTKERSGELINLFDKIFWKFNGVDFFTFIQ